MPTMTCKQCGGKSVVCEHLALSFVDLAERNEELHKILTDLIAWAKASGVAAGPVIDAENRLAKIGRSAVFKPSAPGGKS
jgi:hypothetical protein